MAIDLSELIAARRGRPNEPQAARTVAMYTVIPGALAGLALGLWLFWNERGDKPLWAAAGLAFGAGFGSAAAVSLGYWCLGFWAVVRVADALIGTFVGLTAFVVCTFAADVSGWFLLLVPVGALVGLLAGWRSGAAPRDAAPATEPTGGLEKKAPARPWRK